MSPRFPTPSDLLEPVPLAEAAAQWERLGCVLLRDVLPPGLVHAARADTLTRMREQRAVVGVEGSAQWSGVDVGAIDAFALHRDCPQFAVLAHSSELRAAIEEVAGEAVHVYSSVQIRFALPGDDKHVIPVHQDARYINPDTQFGAFWIALADIPTSHGGLAVIPDSHRDGMYDHILSYEYYSYYMGEERPQRCISLDALDRAGARWSTAEFRLGDVLLFDSFIVHSALPNRSDRVRLSIDGRFQPARRPLVNWQARLSVLEGTERRQRVLELLPDADRLEPNLREALIARMLSDDLPVDAATIAAVSAEMAR